MTGRETMTQGAVETPRPPADGTVVDLDRVTKRFGRVEALSAVSLGVRTGEALAVLGPSGCGKSTLLRCIAGLEAPTSGTVTVAGRTVAGPGVFVPTEKRGVGIVFQDLALFPHLPVAANIGFGLRRGRSAPIVADMLELVGLADKADRFPHELSGGEQQRVAIARALALEPAVVLLDEPFSHLDRGLGARVRREAMGVLRSAGATIVLVTHDQDEALGTGDRIAILRGGHLVQLDDPWQVFHQPADEFVATFLGEADFLDGQRTGDTAQTCLGRVPVTGAGGTGTGQGPVRIVVRPHDLGVVPDEPGAPAGARGVVAATEFRGGEVLHEVVLGDGVAGTGGQRLRAVVSHREALLPGDCVVIPTPVAHPLWALPVTSPGQPDATS